MSQTSPSGRDVLAASAAVGAASMLSKRAAFAADSPAIRPFHVSIPEKALTDLRRRIAATRWPEQETAIGDFAGGAACDD